MPSGKVAERETSGRCAAHQIIAAPGPEASQGVQFPISNPRPTGAGSHILAPVCSSTKRRTSRCSGIQGLRRRNLRMRPGEKQSSLIIDFAFIPQLAGSRGSTKQAHGARPAADATQLRR